MTFGELVRSKRIARGLSQQCVANTLKISQRRVSTIEREQNPNLETIRSFARVLNLELLDFEPVIFSTQPLEVSA